VSRLPVVILAGGLATRLGEVAANVPKILIDVAGRPFAEHQIALLGAQGVTRVVYCIGHLGARVRETLGDGRRWGMTFEFVEDGAEAAGTGGAILRALPRLAGPFFTMYGDAYLDWPLDEIQEAFQASRKPALMTVFRNDDRWGASNVVYRAGRIEAYNKVHRTPDMHHIDYGIGVLTAGVFDGRSAGESFDLAQVHGDLVREGRLAGFEVHRRFYEIGTPAGLQETRAFLGGRTRPPATGASGQR
jgi:NDP-sugar pyrophosphorylase family protein